MAVSNDDRCNLDRCHLDPLDLSDTEQALLHELLADAADVEVAGFSSGFAGMLTEMSFTGAGGARPVANPTSTNPTSTNLTEKVPGIR